MAILVLLLQGLSEDLQEWPYVACKTSHQLEWFTREVGCVRADLRGGLRGSSVPACI